MAFGSSRLIYVQEATAPRYLLSLLDCVHGAIMSSSGPSHEEWTLYRTGKAVGKVVFERCL